MEDIKNKIATWFISQYYEWLADCQSNMTDSEFGRKWGIINTNRKEFNDSIKSLIEFQRWHNGRWIYKWVKEGYKKETIWQLSREGFLSHKEYSNYMARASGNTDFYFISQKTAKEIYKQFKKEKESKT